MPEPNATSTGTIHRPNDGNRGRDATGAIIQKGSDLGGRLTHDLEPNSDRASEVAQDAVRALARQALANSARVSNDAPRSIEAMIDAIDAKLAEQIELIMNHEDFRQMESAWRGLHSLVNNTGSDIPDEPDLTHGIEALQKAASELLAVSQTAASKAVQRGDGIDRLLAEMHALRGSAIAA